MLASASFGGDSFGLNIRAARHNERIKGLATLADNIALALLIAAGAEFYNVHVIDDSVIQAVIVAMVGGLVGWVLRGYLRRED